MTFTVTYRAKNGALREERVEAASRTECVAECRRRGIAPTKIVEGRSGKSAASPRGRDGARPEMKRRDAASPRSEKRRDAASPRGWARWVAAVVLVAVVGGVWWWVATAREDARPPKVEKPKAERPAKPKEAQPPKPAVPQPEQPEVQPEVQPAVDAAKEEKYLGTVTTQRFSRVVRLADGTVTNIRHKAIFRNPMEQILSSALNPRGIAVPLRLALRRFDENQLREMFHTDVKPEPGDSELVLARKMELQDLKEQVRALEKKGHTYDEIFNEIDQMGRETRAEVRMARQGLSHLIKTGESEEVIKEFMDLENKKLKELGEPPLRIPAIFLNPKQ